MKTKTSLEEVAPMKTSLEHRITKMRIRTLSLTSLPATAQFSRQNLHYRPPWSPPSSNSMSKSSIFVLCKCLLIKLCGWVLLMGLWVDGFCEFCCRHCFAGFVVFADSIILLGLWVLIMFDGHWVFEICWVDGKAFFFFFPFSFFCLFSWESHCSSIFFFFFSESEKGKRETFRESDEREERCNGRYKPFKDKDWDGQFLNVMDLIGISSNLR